MDKILVIAGSGRCIWDDLSQLKPITADIMCVNDMIMHYPGEVHHICSLDEKMLMKWWDARRPPYKVQFPSQPRMHTRRDLVSLPKHIETWPFQGGGTSGLFACFVGLGLGYDEIILCGIPIDNTGHYWEDPVGKTNYQREIACPNGRIRGDGRHYWTKAKEKFDGKVKSMSGFTKKLLGAPMEQAHSFYDHKQRI